MIVRCQVAQHILVGTLLCEGSYRGDPCLIASLYDVSKLRYLQTAILSRPPSSSVKEPEMGMYLGSLFQLPEAFFKGSVPAANLHGPPSDPRTEIATGSSDAPSEPVRSVALMEHPTLPNLDGAATCAACGIGIRCLSLRMKRLDCVLS